MGGQWNDELSMELQGSIDHILTDTLRTLAFSCVIADPKQRDCPIVAMSAGFATLTGYPASEVIGRNCRFLLDGVPDSEVDDVMRMKCRAFCKISESGDFLYEGEPKDEPQLDGKQDEKQTPIWTNRNCSLRRRVNSISCKQTQEKLGSCSRICSS